MGQSSYHIWTYYDLHTWIKHKAWEWDGQMDGRPQHSTPQPGVGGVTNSSLPPPARPLHTTRISISAWRMDRHTLLYYDMQVETSRPGGLIDRPLGGGLRQLALVCHAKPGRPLPVHYTPCHGSDVPVSAHCIALQLFTVSGGTPGPQ